MDILCPDVVISDFKLLRSLTNCSSVSIRALSGFRNLISFCLD